ncbi:type II toxin-antitoxin system RelE/ParE family toxin [Pseudomonas synxantha]|uniref:type II toxin-antitoxin system RelE/ParE family toxin n=1 Tax=Pseudomonas synxantha TaxID=47883 RepID=UPI002368537A|nr:type II toxin-antitoxin system RelE/ParE family toxin [Pseudomonas synxantha]WDG42078.1 type II toxin-antitoxin system RelE/ParE family toxin [Pseudomonas synxantha]
MRLRLFKTRHFADAASKAWICDSELREAFNEMLKGQVDNLGGGVWKKRLNRNRHRSIVLAKGRHYWVYQLLFAKQDQSNISQSEPAWFRTLAKSYEGFNEAQIQQMLDIREFVEIRHDQEIQK